MAKNYDREKSVNFLHEVFLAHGGVTDEEMDEFGLGLPLTDAEWMKRQGYNDGSKKD